MTSLIDLFHRLSGCNVCGGGGTVSAGGVSVTCPGCHGSGTVFPRAA